MTRRSSTLHHASSSASTRKRTSTRAVTVAIPSRASKRLKSTTAVSTTPKTISHNHAGLKGESKDESQDSYSHNELDHDQDESAYESEKASLASSASDVDGNDEDEMYDDVNFKRRRRKSQQGKAGVARVAAKGKAQLIPTSGIIAGPGKQVIVRVPKPRQAGDTPYEDHTIHPNTLLFLKDLAKNNRREWLKSDYAHFLTMTFYQHSDGLP